MSFFEGFNEANLASHLEVQGASCSSHHAGSDADLAQGTLKLRCCKS